MPDKMPTTQDLACQLADAMKAEGITTAVTTMDKEGIAGIELGHAPKPPRVRGDVVVSVHPLKFWT